MTCKDCIHYEICRKCNKLQYCATMESFEYTLSNYSERCADFKDKSLIVELPCRVGDTIYRIVKLYSGKFKIVKGELFEFAKTHEYCETIVSRFYFLADGESGSHSENSIWLNISKFGKTVFLTKEEAENALKERENN